MNAMSFCSRTFPGIWSQFVDVLTDTLHAQGPTAKAPPAGDYPALPLVLPAVPRLVSIGDIHGDIGKAHRAFRLAGLIDSAGHWSGGSTVVVQVCTSLSRLCSSSLDHLHSSVVSQRFNLRLGTC